MTHRRDPVSFEEATHEPAYGGKSVSLGSALRAGLPVPDGVALPVAMVDALATGEGAAQELLARLVAELPRRVAVRSSAVGEDSADASFAGQHATFLNVDVRAGVLEAVLGVWQSGRTESALGYRQRLGIGGEPRVAVAIQHMVMPDCAGVLFTKNPMSGADERVIEATWGLGEAVVAGLVTPDFFRLARGGAVLERRVGEKDLAVLPRDDGSTHEVEVEPERISVLCLDDAQLAALEALAARCEAVFEGRHDIEWAFSGGELFLLQRREVTR